jgi:hypothetical protein
MQALLFVIPTVWLVAQATLEATANHSLVAFNGAFAFQSY